MNMREWVRLPTGWIVQGGLTTLRWEAQKGADNAAALMSLGVIAHHADDETGESHLTYDQVCAATRLSRAKISAGLRILTEMGIIERGVNGRSSIRLTKYDRTKGWGKLPAKKMYSSGYIPAFSDFSLRRSAELNALKIYYVVVAFRDNATNMATISYDGIEKYTGIDRARIKGALNVLAANQLVHIEYPPASTVGHFANAYRLTHLDSYFHMGTTGQGKGAEEFKTVALSGGGASSPFAPVFGFATPGKG